jgi:hypothetical protein
MRRIRTHTRIWQREVRKRFSDWEGVFRFDPESAFFEGWEQKPDFDFGEISREGISPSPLAWWLAELCRTAYTPDRKELPRDRRNLLPHREDFLEERTPFSEFHSVHKTGNHASIYRRTDGEGGTILCFRGTSKTRQWIMNLVIHPHGWKRFRREGDPESAFVHSGFYVFFKRIWPKIEPVLRDLPRPWIFTGHSLGGALASIAGAVARADLVCTFGAPKFASSEFHRMRHAGDTWRFVNCADLVPRLPLPDERLEGRQLVHDARGILLGEEEGIRPTEPEEEEGLPFELLSVAGEFHSPPDWLRHHKIGEYCRQLR